jgi:hypothetical protein
VNAIAADDPALVREQKTVMVDGKREIWRLQWGAKPSPICGVEEADISLTCPCSGFTYAEQAPLALIRIRSNGQTERLELGSFFQEDNNPVVGAGGGQAVLQRWAPIEADQPDNDWQHLGDDDFAARVAQRPLADVMKLADFDHDGQATEFLFQVATLPCGKHQMVVVGISKANPHLHVFSSQDNPNQPLILGSWEWQALRDNAGSVDVIDWHCGDHGSDQQWTVHLSAAAGSIHATKTARQCPDPKLSEAYKEMLKLNDIYERKEIPYDEFIKRKMELIKQLPGDPQ